MKTLAMLATTGIITALSGGAAEARIFEPEPNWWSSGRQCIASREPAGRRSEALPPRSCRRTQGDLIAVADAALAEKIAYADEAKTGVFAVALVRDEEQGPRRPLWLRLFY